MRILRSFSALSAGLISLTLVSAASAAEPGLTLRSGRFPVAGLAAGRRALNADLEKAAPAVAFEQLRWASPVSFGAARTVELASGERVVKLPQVHQGLPVAMRGVAVTFGSDAASLVTSRLEEDLPSSVTPAIGAPAAAAVASLAAGRTLDASRGLLALWPTADGAKLAWGFAAEAIPGLAYQPVVIVDAQSGEVILKYNAVTSVNGAKVYPSNPVKSPTLIDVTLPVGAADTALQNELIVSKNCIDTHETISVMGLQIHSCKLLQTAQKPDLMGDYAIAVGADTDPEDAFSEVSMFYHANRVYDFFRSFDSKLDVNPGAPIPTISNLRLPQGLTTFDLAKLGDKNLPLDPFQNAFFSPTNPLFQAAFGVDGGAMWFGQGPLKDYSYDADVIYHEFTHAVVNVTLQLVGAPHMDDLGASYAPGAMNEGLADYFSSALTGDPDVGEYAVQDILPGQAFIRSLAGADTCPSAIGGEVHQDATMFSASLWDARKELSAADQSQLDRAVFTAMNKSATGDLGYEDFAKLILAAVTSSPLGAPAAAKLTAAFTARGLLPRCSRLLDYQGKTLSGPKDLQGLWFAPGTQTTGVKSAKGWTPGVIQIHDALPSGASNLQVSFTAIDIGGGGGLGGPAGTPFTPQILVRFAKDPIQFKYKPLTAQADDVVVSADKVGSSYSAAIPVPAGATDAYVMVLSSGESDGAYTKLSLVTDSVPAETTSTTTSTTTTGAGGGSTTSTTSTTTGAGGGSSGGEDQLVDGCGCAVPGAGEKSTGAALAAIAALGLMASRRRRR